MRHCCSWRECSLDAVERVSLRFLPFLSCIIACELAKGFSDGGIVLDERGAVLAMPRKERSSEALYLSQGRGPLMKVSFSREYVNKNSMLGLLNSHFVGLMVRPDL